MEEVPPLADDELVIYEVNPESSGDYMAKLIALIDRYDNSYAVKNALKKLGFTGLKTKPMDRVEQYRALRDHAKKRDAEDEEE